MKRSVRGFEQVGHFFLSDNCSKGAEASSTDSTTTSRQQVDRIVVPESRKNLANNLETAGALRADKRGAAATPLHHKAAPDINRFTQACDCIGSTVARLEVLQRSCQGVTLAVGGASDRAVWLRGAGVIIREAMATLSEMINPVCSSKPFMVETDEAEDGT